MSTEKQIGPQARLEIPPIVLAEVGLRPISWSPSIATNFYALGSRSRLFTPARRTRIVPA